MPGRPPNITEHIAKPVQDEFQTLIAEPVPERWLELLRLIDETERATPTQVNQLRPPPFDNLGQ